uniref:Translation factor n=1 Tax=Solanum tuberosum TaxID=4113 RepID=M1C862_SOLTU
MGDVFTKVGGEDEACRRLEFCIQGLFVVLLKARFMSELDIQVPTTFDENRLFLCFRVITDWNNMACIMWTDPFADANAQNSGAGAKEYVHIRVQQRNGRKSLTTVQGLKKEFSYNKILKDLKKEFCCNGTVVQDPELGQVIQLQGDQRKNVSTFLIQAGIVKKDNIKIHDSSEKISSSDYFRADSQGKILKEIETEFSEDEEALIIRMYNLLGKRWSLIAGRIPGRSTEEIVKYWNTRSSTSQ